MPTVKDPTSQSPGARRALAIALTAAGACSLAGGVAHAGVTIETQRGAEGNATMYVEGNRMRMDGGDKTGVTTSVIMDGASKKMIVIEDKKKVYTEIGQDDMKRMRAQVEAMRAQMTERMKTMPPEQRKQMETMMAGMGSLPKEGKPAVLKFEKLGQKKTVNGFSCDMYRVLRDGTPTEEDCLTPWGPKSLQKSDLAGLLKFTQEMAKSFGGAGGRDQVQLDQLDTYPGFPITRVPLDPSGTRGQEEQVKSIKRGAVPATRFVIPAGYTKRDLPTNMGAGGPQP